MRLPSFFKKETFLTVSEQERLVAAIQQAEKETSGEIRIYIESRNYLVDPLERAREMFARLQMQTTRQRNGVLIYIAVKHRELAVFADEGIYQSLGKMFWEKAVQEMIHHFKKDDLVAGLEQCVQTIGLTLKEKFPRDLLSDQNELPDDIVFGK